ncbi:MAG: ATP-grasp domain-containing protein [Candidatus Thiodiazotropha sp.]
MRVFVFEYITGGGMLDSPLPSSLAEEGDMMLKALVSDLMELPHIEVVATRDARLGKPDLPIEFHMLNGLDEFFETWLQCIAWSDAVWPIAPEYAEILKHISETVISQGKLLLNSPPQAVQVTSSKLATSRLLGEHGIPVVPTYRFEEILPNRPGSWVVKPDDGVGCQGIRICRDRDDLCRQFESLPMGKEYVIQPFVHGTPTSLNVLAHNGEGVVLSVNHQRVAMTDTGFVLLGCVVNGCLDERDRFYQIGRSVVAALPELWGLIGIDIIDTGDGLQVLEVNPRITTSYVGLKESTGINPAALVLDLLKGKLPSPEQMLNNLVVDVNLEYVGAA